MEIRLRLTRKRVAMLVALGAAIAVGVAYAAIPDANGVYTACMLKKVGTIRIIDPASQQCSASLETKITFNAKGAKGDPGTPGAKGDPGTPGAKGDPGTPGAKGDPGTPGAKGDPGTPGTKGDKGDPCLSSDPACRGPQGLPGQDGKDGADGAQGPPGQPGHDGGSLSSIDALKDISCVRNNGLPGVVSVFTEANDDVLLSCGTPTTHSTCGSEVGLPRATTTLAAAVAAGAENIKLASVSVLGLALATQIEIDPGGPTAECLVAEHNAGSTNGPNGTGVNLDRPTMFAHDSGAKVSVFG